MGDMKPLEWKKLSSNNFQRSAGTGTYGACLEGSGHNCVNVRARNSGSDCSDSMESTLTAERLALARKPSLVPQRSETELFRLVTELRSRPLKKDFLRPERSTLLPLTGATSPSQKLSPRVTLVRVCLSISRARSLSPSVPAVVFA